MNRAATLLPENKEMYFGPCFHLSTKLVTGMPRETSPATLNSPGICLHCAVSVLDWITPTRTNTKGLNLLAYLTIQEQDGFVKLEAALFHNGSYKVSMPKQHLAVRGEEASIFSVVLLASSEASRKTQWTGRPTTLGGMRHLLKLMPFKLSISRNKFFHLSWICLGNSCQNVKCQMFVYSGHALS